MQIFVDSANIQDISALVEFGIIDGVTTNPSLIAATARSTKSVITEISKIVKGPVSAEGHSVDYNSMIKEGEELLGIASNVVLKLPMTWDGVRACKYFSDAGHMVNMTLCFSANQAIIAAKAGATYISPFIGRLDDIGHDGLDLIDDIVSIYSNYEEFTTKVLAASIRSVGQFYQVARMGGHVVTVPPQLIKDLLKHPLTDHGLLKFKKDLEDSGLTNSFEHKT